MFHGRVLPIRATHVTALAALPDLHRDPFDRMLIAQSMAEGWPLVAKMQVFGPIRPGPSGRRMALFKTRSAAVYGIDAHLIDVEVDMFSSGSARDSVMVGMPDTAVRESRERIKSRPHQFRFRLSQ